MDLTLSIPALFLLRRNPVKRFASLIFLFILISLACADSAQPTPDQGAAACIPAGAQKQLGLVTHVVDGDTIQVKIDGQDYRLRYIGINTPETRPPAEYFGLEAAEKNRALVDGKTVTLVKDVSETDKYGRLLRYVVVGDFESGVFVNYELVRQGYANAGTYPPDVACEAAFRQAEGMARGEQLGLWASR